MATVDSIIAAEAITTTKTTTTCSTDAVLKNVESIPKDENKEVSHSLRLLTYNIFIRPPGITNNSNDFKNERLQLFIKNELCKFDIVCLQEMFGSFSFRQSQLISEAKKLGFLYHSNGPSRKLFSMFLVDGIQERG